MPNIARLTNIILEICGLTATFHLGELRGQEINYSTTHGLYVKTFLNDTRRRCRYNTFYKCLLFLNTDRNVAFKNEKNVAKEL